MNVTREQALRFRQAAQRLHKPLPASKILEAARVGVPDSMTGSALLGLAARVDGLAPDAVEEARLKGPLVSVWGPRIAPRVVPAEDLPAFTVALLPETDDGLRPVVANYARELRAVEVEPLDALAQVADAMEASLVKGPLTKGALSEAASKRVPEALRPWCRGCGVHHVSESLFRAAAWRGRIALLPTSGKEPLLGLRRAPPKSALVPARAELVRRYLHAFGPSTPSHFAQWAGVGPAHAERMWDAAAPGMREVGFEGRRAWVLAADERALAKPPAPADARLLPAYDAYLEQRDRERLVPDKSRHKAIWKILGNPGVVLVEGEVAGTWRAKKKGKTLEVAVEAFGRLAATGREAVRAEAARLAPLKGCVEARVAF